MKKIVIISLWALCVPSILCAQSISATSNEKFIEVVGSAEMKIAPKTIYFTIGIEEYWEEEFKKGAEEKDYRTKLPLATIEADLLKKLAAIGIDKSQITIKEVGNYWRMRGKSFLVSKQLEIRLDDFQKINDIINKANIKGIEYMRISRLDHPQLAEYRKQVKIEALKAAKAKADYFLESIGKKTGDVLMIVEIDSDRYGRWLPPSTMSNVMVSSPSDSDGEDELRSIKLRYEVKTRFAIL
ncbi:MAG: SIMPL domain-containing protein [Thermonemataceae bacterium]